MEQQPDLKDLIPLSEASLLSGFTIRHLRKLVSEKKLWGIQLGRNWFTTKKALEEYKSVIHKTGPKPKKS
jgi:hypothetical protein